MVFFLLGTFVLTALSSACRRIHKQDLKKHFTDLGNLFFYRSVQLFFFPDHEYEAIFFSTICAQNITRFCSAALIVVFGQSIATVELSFHGIGWIVFIVSLLPILAIFFIITDYLPRIFGTQMPVVAIRLCAPLASVFMFLSFPIIFIILKLSHFLSQTIYFDYLQEPAAQAKQEIIDIVQKARLSPQLDPHDKKLIASVLKFRELIVREVMVPRVDLFCLPIEMSIKEAAKLLENEGYSRVPVYHDTIDNIVGVLMYKDILSKYREYLEKGNALAVLEAPIETIQKNVLYTPETKKISQLLQEFRKKQMHLAIVVDEYGGTEGIVTIEDTLEEIVGDISDEYDEEEEALFIPQADGCWIVDPRMSILSAEEKLGLIIPQEGEYDSIGGFIFHCAGAIPAKGFVIHREDFEIEILSSNERSIEKVRIKPLRSLSEYDQNSVSGTE
jgi:putative hemolysin